MLDCRLSILHKEMEDKGHLRSDKDKDNDNEGGIQRWKSNGGSRMEERLHGVQQLLFFEGICSPWKI